MQQKKISVLAAGINSSFDNHTYVYIYIFFSVEQSSFVYGRGAAQWSLSEANGC
jgi:hypothetical protein